MEKIEENEKIKCYLDISALIAFISHGNKFTDEACGGLTGINKITKGWVNITEFHPWKNIGSINKHVDYVPNPKDLLETLRLTTHINPKANRDLVGIGHTHPDQCAPIPSYTDIFGNGQKSAENSGYAGIYLIYSPGLGRLSGQYYDGENFGFKEIN